MQAATTGGGTGASAVQTDVSGQFSFVDVGSENWQIVPQKFGDNTGVSILDAVYILESTVGNRTLSPGQKLACDVSGEGQVSILDAVLLLQYTVSLISQFPAAQRCNSDWVFVPQPAAFSNQDVISPAVSSGACQPGAIAFNPLVGQAVGQDFLGVVLGDCSGNWQPTTSGGFTRLSAARATPSSAIRLGRQTRHGGTLRLKLHVRPSGTFRALSTRIAYNPAHLSAPRVRRTRLAANALLQFNPQAPGDLSIGTRQQPAAPWRGGHRRGVQRNWRRRRARDHTHQTRHRRTLIDYLR